MRLLILSSVCFVLVVVSILITGWFFTSRQTPIDSGVRVMVDTNYYPPIPVLKEGVARPTLTARAVYAMDVDSGVTLYEKNADERLLPASTTKIITALVALDYYPLDKVLTVGSLNVDGQKMRLVPGERIKVADLITGLLVYSANDAAEVLAQNYEGGKVNFVNDMNRKAKEIFLRDTLYRNPAGYDEEGQFTTARDLARLAAYAMKYDFFAKTVARKEAYAESVDKKFKHKLTNLNQLIGEVQGVLGVKTGWTEKAKENLVTYLERDGKKIMIVVLGSDDRFGETQKLIDWIFSNFTWKDVRSL